MNMPCIHHHNHKVELPFTQITELGWLATGNLAIQAKEIQKIKDAGAPVRMVQGSLGSAELPDQALLTLKAGSFSLETG